MRKAVLWIFAGLLLPLALINANAEDAASWWIAPANGGGPAILAAPGDLHKPQAFDALLWREGRPFLSVGKGSVPEALARDSLPLEVRVVGEDLAPLSNLLIEFRPSDSPNLPEPMGRVFTSADGSAVLWRLPGQSLDVWIEDPTWLPAKRTASPGEWEIVLKTRRTQGYWIKVQDTWGRDVSGARVVVPTSALESDPFALLKPGAKEVSGWATDNTGLLLLPNGARPNAVFVWAPGLALGTVAVRPSGSRVRLSPTQAFSVKLAGWTPSTQAVEVQGDCVFALPGFPSSVQQFEVRFSRHAAEVAPPVYPCRLEVRCPGYATQSVYLERHPEPETLQIALEKAISLLVRVTDETDRALPGAILTWKEDGRRIRLAAENDGSVSLKDLSPARVPYRFTVHKDGFLEEDTPPIDPRRTPLVHVRLSQGAQISGRVAREEDLQPVGGTRGVCEALSGDSSQGPIMTISTQDDGTFRVSGLEGGDYRLTFASSEGIADAVDVHLLDRQVADVGTLLLRENPVLEGRLVFPEGDTVPPGVPLTLRLAQDFKDALAERPWKSRQTSTGDKGIFRFAGIGKGSFFLEAHWAGWTLRHGPITVGREDIHLGDIVLRRPAALGGVVLSTGSFPLEGYRVSLSDGPFDIKPKVAWLAEDGTFRFDQVTPGVLLISVFEPLHATPKTSLPVSLAEGEEKEIQIPLEGTTLELLLSIEGVPASEGYLVIRPSSPFPFQGILQVFGEGGSVTLGLPPGQVRGNADQAGRLVLQGVRPGPAQALLSLGGMRYLQNVVVPEGSPAAAQWNFQGRTVTGSVVDSEGAPVSSAVIHAGYSGQGTFPGFTTRTDASGRFELAGLGEGAIVLSARTADGRTATYDLSLSFEVPSAPVVIRLSEPGPGAP